nr:LysR family transcriptional regulator [Acinetobacter sp. Marseille-Q1620]
MKLEELEAFTTFVKLQSTNQAATQLGITQPALSRRIQNLEQALDLQLFDRNTRPLKLTSLGLQVYEQSKNILKETRRLESIIANHKIDTMLLNIGFANSITDIGLAKILEQLNDIYPNIEVKIHAAWGKDLIKKLENGELDGIVSVTGLIQNLPETLDRHVLGKLKVMPVIAKKIAKQNIKYKDELQSYGWILNSEGCGLRGKLFEIFALVGQKPNINFEVLGTQLQLDLVAQGLGIGLLPKEVMLMSRRKEDVICIENTDVEFDVQLFTAHQQGIHAEKIQIIERIGHLVRKQLKKGMD